MSILKVYVAGAWVEQHERARPMIARLRATGVEITCDWTVAEGSVARRQHERLEKRNAYPADAPPPPREFFCALCQAPWPLEGQEPETPCVQVQGDGDLSKADRIKFAQADLNGVWAADLFLLCAPETKDSSGSWVELGAALTHNRWLRLMRDIPPHLPIRPQHILVSGVKARRSVFTELADAIVDTDEEAFRYVMAFAGRRGLVLQGWQCVCGTFDGEEKERLANCRNIHCSKVRPA